MIRTPSRGGKGDEGVYGFNAAVAFFGLNVPEPE